MTSVTSKKVLAVAPMMDWTDRHCRYFLRLISPYAWLYTEMVTTGAILFGDKERFLAFDPAEHPIALQLGGSDPKALAEAAAEGEKFGYDEININVGCPSDRVQNGRFGACLMAEPDLVADGVSAIRDRVDLPVTVKTRIGIDDRDDYGFLSEFIGKVRDAGCRHVIIHPCTKSHSRRAQPQGKPRDPAARLQARPPLETGFSRFDGDPERRAENAFPDPGRDRPCGRRDDH